MNKIKSITDNDQRKLVGELRLLYFVQKKGLSNQDLLKQESLSSLSTRSHNTSKFKTDQQTIYFKGKLPTMNAMNTQPIS